MLFFLVFLNQSMVAFLDKDRTVPYQPTDGCIGDEGTGMATNLHPADCSCTGELLRSITLLT